MTIRPMSRTEVRDVDRKAVEIFGMPGVVLMENAGRGAADVLVELGISGPVVVCAGKGNNGGDGFVIARHLENRGFEVRVLLFADPNQLRGDALINHSILAAAGTSMVAWPDLPSREKLDRELASADWIIDALLGTGTTGEVREPYRTIIESINTVGARTLAVDLPSGMDCDTGETLGLAVRADHTATFVAPKLGFETMGASFWTGVVHVIDIGVPRSLLAK